MLDWEHAKPLLEPALDGTYTIDDVKREIDANRAELWWLGSAAVVTQIMQYPAKRCLRVWLAGGDLDTIKRAAPALDDIARELGCSRIEIEGRKGWERALDGYDTQRLVLSKDV